MLYDFRIIEIGGSFSLQFAILDTGSAKFCSLPICFRDIHCLLSA